MRGSGWAVAGVGSLIGLVVALYAVRWASFADAADGSTADDRARLALVGVAIVVTAFVAGLIVSRPRQWPTYVFIWVGALAAMYGLAWALTEIVGSGLSDLPDLL